MSSNVMEYDVNEQAFSLLSLDILDIHFTVVEPEMMRHIERLLSRLSKDSFSPDVLVPSRYIYDFESLRFALYCLHYLIEQFHLLWHSFCFVFYVCSYLCPSQGRSTGFLELAFAWSRLPSTSQITGQPRDFTGSATRIYYNLKGAPTQNCQWCT
jgi:hypothetical protein